MKITTQQVDSSEALRAVADGKHVEMIWMNGGELVFRNFTEKIRDAMANGAAFLIVEAGNDENAEKIASSQQNLAETCDSAAEENGKPAAPPGSLDELAAMLEKDVKTDVVTDQEIAKAGPKTVKIDGNPNNARRRRRLDTNKIIALKKSGWSVNKIADEMNAGWGTVNNVIIKAEKEGKL